MADHVLVPMDASELSREALLHALDEFPDATITTLHVTNPIEDTFVAGEEDFSADFEALEERSREIATSILDTAEEIAAEHDRTVGTERAFGAPAAEIVEYAEDHGVDHIVLGSHGRSGLARLFLGSVAEKVTRRSTVPVTIIK